MTVSAHNPARQPTDQPAVPQPVKPSSPRAATAVAAKRSFGLRIVLNMLAIGAVATIFAGKAIELGASDGPHPFVQASAER